MVQSLFVLQAGGNWNDSSNYGVGSRNSNNSRANLNDNNSVRGLDIISFLRALVEF